MTTSKVETTTTTEAAPTQATIDDCRSHLEMARNSVVLYMEQAPLMILGADSVAEMAVQIRLEADANREIVSNAVNTCREEFPSSCDADLAAWEEWANRNIDMAAGLADTLLGDPAVTVDPGEMPQIDCK